VGLEEREASGRSELPALPYLVRAKGHSQVWKGQEMWEACSKEGFQLYWGNCSGRQEEVWNGARECGRAGRGLEEREASSRSGPARAALPGGGVGSERVWDSAWTAVCLLKRCACLGCCTTGRSERLCTKPGRPEFRAAQPTVPIARPPVPPRQPR
jgi:hypothetical protein